MEPNAIVARALHGEVVCNIGQVTDECRRELDGLVRQGKLKRWRGFWHPIVGAPFGLGNLKTCWSTPETYQGLWG